MPDRALRQPKSSQASVHPESSPASPTKVLAISTSYPQSLKFMPGIFVYNLCEALARQGAQVTVLSPSDVELDPNFTQSEGVQLVRGYYFFRRGEIFFHRPPGGLPQRFKKFSFAWFLAPSAFLSIAWKAFWQARRADVIHCHWLPTAMLAIPGAKFWKKPIVTTVHGSDAYFLSKTRIGRRLIKFIFNNSQRIISVNENFIDWIQEELPEYADRAVFQSNGVSQLPETASRAAAEPNPICRLLFIGNVVSDKGIRELQSATTRLVSAGYQIQLSIVGSYSPDSLPDFLDWVEAHAEFVRYLGSIPQEQVLREMATHDLFVLPTYREGRCSVIMEAMAARIPILTTNIPSMVEMLEHGKEACLVEPENEEAFYEGLRWCLDHREALTKMAAAATERFAKEGQTWDACAVSHMELYQQVLSGEQAQTASDKPQLDRKAA